MSDHLQRTFYCGKTGKPFLVEFSRQGRASPYTITRIAKIETGAPCASRTTSARKPETATLDAQSVDFTGFKCAHCNAAHDLTFVHCGACGHDVCMGGASRDLWRCMPSCGNGVPLKAMGLIQSYSFTKTEKPAPAATRPQRHLPHLRTPVFESTRPLQTGSRGEAVKIEQPQPQSRSLIIRRNDT